MNPHKRVGKAGFITRWIGDTAYKCGQCFYKSMPGPISDKVQSAAPDSIKNVDGAIERTCCLFVFLQVSLVFVFPFPILVISLFISQVSTSLIV